MTDMTAAQATQQTNRTGDGKYATKEQAPADGVELGVPGGQRTPEEIDAELMAVAKAQADLRERKIALTAELVATEIHGAHPEAAYAVLSTDGTDPRGFIDYFADANGNRIDLDPSSIEGWDYIDDHLTNINWWDESEADLVGTEELPDGVHPDQYKLFMALPGTAR